jgi:hypothetical protein
MGSWTKKDLAKLQAKRGGLTPSPSRPKHVYRGTVMRSGWEVMYARHLDGLRDSGVILEWKYEPERFLLGKACSYCPDFRVLMSDRRLIYVEVKGYNRPTGNVKFKTTANLNNYAMFLMVYFRNERPVIKQNLGADLMPPVTLRMFGEPQ